MKKRRKEFWGVMWNYGIFLVFFCLDATVGIYKTVYHERIHLEQLIPNMLCCLIFAWKGYNRWKKEREAKQETGEA